MTRTPAVGKYFYFEAVEDVAVRPLTPAEQATYDNQQNPKINGRYLNPYATLLLSLMRKRLSKSSTKKIP